MANFCKTILEDFFSVYFKSPISGVQDTLYVILEKGVVRPQCCDTCPVCDYVFASTETYLKYAEAIGVPQPGCCFSYYVKEESRNMMIEINSVFEFYDKKEGDVYILDSKCKSNFSKCVEFVKNTIGEANFNILLEKGFVENERLYNQSALCFILNYYLDNGVTDPLVLTDVLVGVMDRGVVISCIGKNFTVIGSVETYLKFAEGIGLTIPAQVP
jgi:hypothetical protein